jgi:hypothetical protein
MVNHRKQHTRRKPAKQGVRDVIPEPNKINASTAYDFRGKNLTPYGGLLPVATMLEKLGFQSLLEETVTVNRVTKCMGMYQFFLGIVLGIYVGFSRLNQLRFIAQDPLLTGILKASRLPPQSTLWQFLAALHLNVAVQILSVQQQMRERVWAAAHVCLTVATLDTDTTVHTLYGKQMGGRKSYNPKNKGKKSYQPILTFLAETREYIAGGLRNGDRPTGKEIAEHLRQAFRTLPACVKRIFARAGPRGHPRVLLLGRRGRLPGARLPISSLWRARRRPCWRICVRRNGNSRRRPTPTHNANSPTSPTDGRRLSALWPCAMSNRRSLPTK